MLIWLATTMDSLWGLFLDQGLRDTKEAAPRQHPHFPLNPDCLIGIRK